MSIGASVVLIALGAILAFATSFEVGGVDIQLVGLILMFAGAIGLIASLIATTSRRRGAVVTERYVDDRSAY